jgi:hypothetical protein
MLCSHYFQVDTLHSLFSGEEMLKEIKGCVDWAAMICGA